MFLGCFFFTSDWSYSSLSLLAHAYLDSRNARCAIFSINTRQTLKKQADESVDFIWHTLPSTSTTVAWKNKSAFTHILSLFANCTLWALDTSAALQKINKSASVEPRCTSVSLPPFKLWNSFFFFFFYTNHCLDKKTFRETTTRVTHFVSFIAWLSRWSTRSFLTLKRKEQTPSCLSAFSVWIYLFIWVAEFVFVCL